MFTGSWGRGQHAQGAVAVLERCVWDMPSAAQRVTSPLHWQQHPLKATQCNLQSLLVADVMAVLAHHGCPCPEKHIVSTPLPPSKFFLVRAAVQAA